MRRKRVNKAKLRDLERARQEGQEASVNNETPAERHKRLAVIRESAIHANESYLRDLREFREDGYRIEEDEDTPLFMIEEKTGETYCMDGKPVTSTHQVGCELFYRFEQALGGMEGRLVHDEQREAYCTKDGELAVSREELNVQHLMG